MPQGEDAFHAANYQAAGELVEGRRRCSRSRAAATTTSRLIPFQAAMSVAWGLNRDEAIKALTINAAKIFGADKALGSLEVGKIANLVVVSGRSARDSIAHPARGDRRARHSAREQADRTVQALHGTAVRRGAGSPPSKAVKGRPTARDHGDVRCATCEFSSCSSRRSVAAAVTFGPLGAASRAGPLYAIKGARIFTAAGAPIAGGTIVMRNGVIEDVGANVTAPADAIVIDAHGHERVSGSDRHGQRRAARSRRRRGAGRGGGGGGGGGGAARRRRTTFATLEEAERAKRDVILRPDFMAAENLQTTNAALRQLASAGVTTVLAVPSGGIFKGQSALVNVVVPPDDPQISTIADYRKGLAVVKSPVAMHINMAGRGGGQGYPGSLLGIDRVHEAGTARCAVAARCRSAVSADRREGPAADHRAGARRAEAGAGETDAGGARRGQRRARSIARSRWRPNSASIRSSSAPPKRRIARRNSRRRRRASSSASTFPAAVAAARGAGGGGGGRGGGGAGPSLAQLKAQANAPKTPAALAQANVGVRVHVRRQHAGRVRAQRRPDDQGRRPVGRRRCCAR